MQWCLQSNHYLSPFLYSFCKRRNVSQTLADLRLKINNAADSISAEKFKTKYNPLLFKYHLQNSKYYFWELPHHHSYLQQKARLELPLFINLESSLKFNLKLESSSVNSHLLSLVAWIVRLSVFFQPGAEFPSSFLILDTVSLSAIDLVNFTLIRLFLNLSLIIANPLHHSCLVAYYFYVYVQFIQGLDHFVCLS